MATGNMAYNEIGLIPDNCVCLTDSTSTTKVVYEGRALLEDIAKLWDTGLTLAQNRAVVEAASIWQIRVSCSSATFTTGSGSSAGVHPLDPTTHIPTNASKFAWNSRTGYSYLWIV